MTFDEFLDLAHCRSIMKTFIAGDGHRSIGMSSRQEYEQAMMEAVNVLWVSDDDPLTEDGHVIPGDQIELADYWKYYDWGLWSEEELLKNPNERIQFETEMNIAVHTSGKKRRAAKEAVWEKYKHLDFGV